MKPSKSKLSTAKANAQINREIATLEDQLKQVPRLFGKTDRAKREADDIKKEIKELKKKLK
jgi:ABC-type enterochelin transport system substrate-binding protein